MVELNNSAVFSWGSEYLMPTYSRLPVVFLKGNMQYLWDVEAMGALMLAIAINLL